MTKKHTNKWLKWEETIITKHYKLIAKDLNKQTELRNSDLKQQINFIGRLRRNEGATKFFITEKSEETTSKFPQNAATVVWFLIRIIMGAQKIANLLGHVDNESSTSYVQKKHRLWWRKRR